MESSQPDDSPRQQLPQQDQQRRGRPEERQATLSSSLRLQNHPRHRSETPKRPRSSEESSPRECRDVESNPGPPKRDSTRQTSLTGGQRLSLSGQQDSAQTERLRRGSQSTTEPTMSQMMEMLTRMDIKMDITQEEMKEMKASMDSLNESFSGLKEEVEDLKKEVSSLKKSNSELSEINKKMEQRMSNLEMKVDDLEGRSKRNNIMVHGFTRQENERSEDCEHMLKDMLTDQLELSGDVQFDRGHRVNSKSNSPIIARCTFYKDKVKILKAKRKLKGTNVFIGEDFSQRVRNIRKKLGPHLKAARDQEKRATMVYDHLLIDGKKFVLNETETNVREK
ncbi:hypothetical protein ACOMHN_022014 [Nucella lapillus]